MDVVKRTLQRNGIAGCVALLFLDLRNVLPCPPICQLCSTDTVECEDVSSLQEVLIALPSSTQQILLQQGNLSEIPPLSFSNFTSLYFLSITGFLVSSLADFTFFTPYVNPLKILDLSNNQLNRLTTLPTLPDSIKFLVLHRNPWVCNCQLIQSMQSVEAKIQSPTGVTCERPSFLAGHQVTSSKFLGCDPSPSSYLSSHLFSTIDFPPLRSGTLKLICGLLGGFFLGFTVSLFCCYCLPKCCSCQSPFANQSRNTKALSSSGVKPSVNPGGKTSGGDSQILSGLPAAESSALEGGRFARGTRCGPFVSPSQICYGEQVRFQSPLVAYLSVDPMGRSIVAFCEKGHEARCPVFGQPGYPALQDHTNKGTEVSRDGGIRDQRCPTCMQGLRGSRVLPATIDQIAKMQPGSGEQVDHQMNSQTWHPEIHLRDTQPLPALVHIDFPDGSAMKIEHNRAASRTSPSKRNESHESRSYPQASPSCLRRKRRNHGHPHHQSQIGFASPESNSASDLRHWQESWTGRKDPRRSDLHLTFADPPNKSQRWKRCPLHPTHEVTSTPSLSSVSSQPEANRFHHLNEPCPRWFSVPHCPGKRTRASQEFEKAQQAGETFLSHRRSRSRREDPRCLTRKESTLNRIWKCQNCGCEGSAPCSVNTRRSAQPGIDPRRTFLDASTQWSSTDAVRLKEHEFALTFLGAPHNIAKTRSEERWLAACFPNFQPSSVRAHGPGEIDSIYEYPSPLLSTTAFHPPSVFVEGPMTESIRKHQNHSTDFLKVPDTEPTSLADPLADRWPPEKKAFRSLGEEVQRSEEEILLEAIALDGEKPSEDSEGDPVTPSPVVSGFSFRMDANPSLQELPVSIRGCSQVTFSAIPEDTNPKTCSIMTLCPLVHKMFQIDFPLPAEEEEEAKPFQGEE
ncbi:uncharacterized protein LOC117670266 isoform X2 [Pantherophis guttatus]|uniref:Uncharacterized protein LOC117670266 isoform X2 n=1 Tax=Pantherophis guttatus TaxID=94885 RepID=A0ABM3ZRN7_PANGU|nr:uncharacterized protein LOC117670266 isoform X2 [Pantherophis guttatus]